MMSTKMTCARCDAHTSAVYAAFRDGEPCPYCGHLPGDVEAARAFELRLEQETPGFREWLAAHDAEVRATRP